LQMQLALLRVRQNSLPENLTGRLQLGCFTREWKERKKLINLRESLRQIGHCDGKLRQRENNHGTSRRKMIGYEKQGRRELEETYHEKRGRKRLKKNPYGKQRRRKP